MKFDIKKSMQKVGQLYPILKDKTTRETLDGKTREKMSPLEKLDEKLIDCKDEIDRITVRLVANLMKRGVVEKEVTSEIKEELNKLADAFVNLRGIKKGEIVKTIHQHLNEYGFIVSDRWVRKHLASQYKTVTHPIGMEQRSISIPKETAITPNQLSFWLHGKAYHWIDYFDRTPIGIVCPHFWVLKWADGCPFQCDFCFLCETLYGETKPRSFRNRDDLKCVLKGFYDLIAPMYCKHFNVDGCVLNSGELAESFMLENTDKPFTTFIIPTVESLNATSKYKHKVLFLTKSNWVKSLENIREHESAIISFSLNLDSMAKKHEHGAPTVDERLVAFRNVINWGYQDVRLRFDGMAPINNWQKECDDLVDKVFKGSKYEPSRITIGSLRFFGSYKRDPQGVMTNLQGLPYWVNKCGRDISVFDYDFDSNYPDDRNRLTNRKAMYERIINKLNEYGYHNFSLCKESIGMWNLLNMNLQSKEHKCNCEY